MNQQLHQAVANLHREKSAAHGNAWTKRGEVMSVMANLARKVDRLAAGTTTRDESTLDTAVDLLVYTIKYLTLLADLDPNVARSLFAPTSKAPYSDGPAGIDALWDAMAAADAQNAPPLRTSNAVAAVDRAFGDLERCFDTATARTSPAGRAAHAKALADASLALVEAVSRDDRTGLAQFIDTWKDTTGDAR